MFTGIILKLGKVADRKGKTLRVRTDLRCSRGESVAVNGACLTVTRRNGGALAFDVSAETFRLTNLGALKPGAHVNRERALRMGDIPGGHMVSGHVDSRGKVIKITPLPGGFSRFRISLPPALRGFAALKGSIAIDTLDKVVD